MTVKECLWRCYSQFKKRLPDGLASLVGIADTQIVFSLMGMSEEDAVWIAREIVDLVEPLRAAVLAATPASGLPTHTDTSRTGEAVRHTGVGEPQGPTQVSCSG